jgi:hypothetical protein
MRRLTAALTPQYVISFVSGCLIMAIQVNALDRTCCEKKRTTSGLMLVLTPHILTCHNVNSQHLTFPPQHPVPCAKPEILP